METLISAKNITCGYSRQKDVLSDFDFFMRKGEFTGIIGPNGMGKSTVLKVLSGFMKPFSGQVKIADVDISKMSSKQRSRKLAVVPQNIYTPLPFSVRQIVEMGRASRISRFTPLSKEDKEAIDYSLEKMDLSGYGNNLFNELSGGEKQRVMIAAALAQEPEILLLDEPTSQLDLGHSAQLMKLLKTYNLEEKTAILIVSHDIQLAAGFCTRLVLMKNGSIVADDNSEGVLQEDIISDLFDCEVSVRKITDSGNWMISAK